MRFSESLLSEEESMKIDNKARQENFLIERLMGIKGTIGNKIKVNVVRGSI